MTKFVSRAVEVEAFQFQKQTEDQWPEWMKTYKGQDGVGQITGIANSMGVLLVPIASKTVNLHSGDWLVFRDGKIIPLRAAEFAEQYDAIAD